VPCDCVLKTYGVAESRAQGPARSCLSEVEAAARLSGGVGRVGPTSHQRSAHCKVSQVRSSVSANEKAEVRKLVFVKKQTQIKSITPDTASEAIAAGDN
jgi:hypothetical protein